MTKVTILGGGWSAQTLAADLAIYGWTVTLFDFPQYKEKLSYIAETLAIEKYGSASSRRRVGVGRLARVTFDLAEAVAGAELLILAVPAYAHAAFFDGLATVLTDGQKLLVTPGNWGAMRLRRKLDETRPGNGVIIGETDICFGPTRAGEAFVGPGRVRVISERKSIRLAAIPAADTPALLDLLSGPYPELRSASNVVETSLCNTNPSTHAPLMLMNAGWIEHAGKSLMIYRDATTPTVTRGMDALSSERDAVVRAMGIDLPAVEYDSYARLKGAAWCEDPCETAPSSLEYRYLLEDIPFGLMPLAELAALTGTDTPVTDALITLAGLANRTDHRKNGLGLRGLGLAGLGASQILDVARSGKGWQT